MKFLELEVVQANAKVEWVSTKKLDDVISHKKSFSDKTGLGYTGESSSAVNVFKEVKFVGQEANSGYPYCWESEGEEEKECGWSTSVE